MNRMFLWNKILRSIPEKRGKRSCSLKLNETIARSYHSAQCITARTPVTDQTGSLPAGLWGHVISGGASHLDAFSGYPVRT